ncbi:MAG TPA: VWA domain-containing protein [Candidatus Angelobacter sp.]
MLGFVGRLFCVGVLASMTAMAQNIPDAPQPKTQPPGNPFPDAPPAPKNNHPAQEPGTVPPPQPTQNTQQQQNGISSSRDDLYRFHSNVTFVEVPVTVKDNSGHLVEGLTSNDFTVYEDGVPQRLSYFSGDPFPLSVAVVVDTNLPAGTMKKINDTLPALVGAFSEFDEVALYRYGNSVSQVSGFNGAGQISTASLEQMKRPGRTSGPPVVGGPLGSQGPVINGRPVDPNVPPVYTAPQDVNVLNDAILRAAQDLSRRQKAARRRVIFVISDGREYRSTANYGDVRRFLLSQNISVYALGVDIAALPVYDKLNRIRLPGFGYGNILGKYANDTGGETFAEFDKQSIEQAYSRITSFARNQYTLGYNTKGTLSSTYRSIDVHVHRPDLQVIAKSGYYSLPPAPPTSH